MTMGGLRGSPYRFNQPTRSAPNRKARSPRRGWSALLYMLIVVVILLVLLFVDDFMVSYYLLFLCRLWCLYAYPASACVSVFFGPRGGLGAAGGSLFLVHPHGDVDGGRRDVLHAVVRVPPKRGGPHNLYGDFAYNFTNYNFRQLCVFSEIIVGESKVQSPCRQWSRRARARRLAGGAAPRRRLREAPRRPGCRRCWAPGYDNSTSKSNSNSNSNSNSDENSNHSTNNHYY